MENGEWRIENREWRLREVGRVARDDSMNPQIRLSYVPGFLMPQTRWIAGRQFAPSVLLCYNTWECKQSRRATLEPDAAPQAVRTSWR